MKIRRPDGKIVGEVDGNVFKKVVSASVHFLREPPSIANDLDVLNQAKQAGATMCEIIDRETGKKYVASMNRIWKDGIAINRGHGEQLALLLDQWNKDKPDNQIKLF
jgi:hypothetical protein